MLKKCPAVGTFFCKKCDYTTQNKYDWTKHQKTSKHIRLCDIQMEKSSNIFMNHVCSICNKSYKFVSGLSRHMKNCKSNVTDISRDVNVIKSNEVNIVNKQSEQIKNLHELLQKTIENQNSLIEKVGNTTNNISNTMTINLILNERYKNAMSLGDFMDSVQLSLDDLKYTCDNGYIKGITNIFLKNMIDMNPNIRPFHCSDNNTSLEFFVKEEDIWEHDNKHKKINKSIEQITQRQIQQIKAWELDNPDWNEVAGGVDSYMNMIKHVMGGMTDNEKSSNIEIIKKELGNKMEISNMLEDNEII